MSTTTPQSGLTASTPMPAYVCHKRVSALKIKEVITYGAGLEIRFEDPRYASSFIDYTHLEHKPEPKPGMYFVQYENNYISFSPADVFEKGYSPELSHDVSHDVSLKERLQKAAQILCTRFDINHGCLYDLAEQIDIQLRLQQISLIDLTDSDNLCFTKAHRRGEPTFTLRGQDIMAIPAIMYWLTLNAQLPKFRQDEVLKKVEKMRLWHFKKNAD